jgi:hypothetical protein
MQPPVSKRKVFKRLSGHQIARKKEHFDELSVNESETDGFHFA